MSVCAGDPALEGCFGPLLDLALRVRHQEQRQRGPKVYSLHAPEVECIGKGKARKPHEFGCKVSIATPATGYTFSLLMRWFEELLRVQLQSLRGHPWLPRVV
jgi:hypothetical protein